MDTSSRLSDQALPATPLKLRRRFTLRHLFLWATVAAVVLAIVSYPIHATWRAYHRLTTSMRPYHLSFAMHSYAEQHKRFPPAVVYDDAGRPVHSWRVLLTPYLDRGAWYNGYRFEEPWNSPFNDAHCRATDIAAQCFASTDARNIDGYCTNFVVVRGPGTIFPAEGSLAFDDIPEPHETLMLVEIPPSNIRWHEPRDLDIRTMSFQLNDPDRPCIGNARGDGAWVAFADGSTQWLPNATPPERVRAMLTVVREE